jgi:hypothetical protein
MVGVFIDDDIVAVPKPVAAEADVVGRYAEIETTKPEAVGPAARQMPDMPAPESAREAPVFPGMIEMVVRIVGSGIVADPLSFA